MITKKAKKTQWQGRAEVIRVIDGDTFEALIDLGFKISATVSVRIGGINAPELDTAAGVDAASFLSQILPAGRVVAILSHRLDLHGRSEATVLLTEGEATGGPYTDLANVMVTTGHAHPSDDRNQTPKG